MHELAITTTLVRMIQEECKKKKVVNPKKIELELGRFTNYKKEPIEFYYDLLKKEIPLLEKSELIIREIKGKVRCNECKKESTIDDPLFTFCIHCNSGNVDIIYGKDILLKEIIRSKDER
jgi:hydrogenase nickel incorporation protein HypA/HybF